MLRCKNLPATIVLAAIALLGHDSTPSCGQPGTSDTVNLNLSAEQWREDLQFFARELAKRHASAFHFTPAAHFNAEVAKLERQIEHLNGDEIYVAMDRIANLVGDGHTYVAFPPDCANLPIDVSRFGEDYRVTTVAPGLEMALGTRIVKIGKMPIAKVREALVPLTPQNETPWLAEGRIAGFLTTGMALHGVGVTSERGVAGYTLTDDAGNEFVIDVHALRPGERPKWIAVYKAPPLYRQKPGEPFWFTYIRDAKTMYCCFRGYKGLGKQAAALLKAIADEQPDKLVIDLRQNGGGDYTDGLRHLIRPIKNNPKINAKGRLFVLIGPNTFSAAMSNSAHFRQETAAILVGQPIGEKPNSYQESRKMTLPNSHLEVRYSIKYYKFVDTEENVIRPDHEIIPTWSEFKAGKDPALDWVLKYEVK